MSSPMQRKKTRCFLSAAQPTDQGEESVLFLVVGGHFSVSHVQTLGV